MRAEGSKKEPKTFLQTLGLLRNNFNFINTKKNLLKPLIMFYLGYFQEIDWEENNITVLL